MVVYIYKSPSSPASSLSWSTLNVFFCRMAMGISTGMSSQSWWPTLGRSSTPQKFRSWPLLKRSFVFYLWAKRNKIFIINTQISNLWYGPFVYTETTNNSYSGNDWRSRCRWRRSNQLWRILQHDDIMFAESVCQKINTVLFKFLI